jgi:cytochrome c oxidase subunit 4
MTTDTAEATTAHEVVDDSHHVHTTTTRLLAGIFFGLVILTILTVAISRIDFGEFNMLIALAIAAVKASMVMTVFMHLKWDTAINNIAFLSSLLFLSLLFLFCIADFATRADADPVLVQKYEVPDRPNTDRWYHGEGH